MQREWEDRMLQAKICMLGATAVGKTSLVSRFVHSVFSDKYLTSIGVKIDKKHVKLGPDAGALCGEDVTLMLWDLYGDDEFQRIRTTYLRGAAGFILVADGTRTETLETALRLSDLEPGLAQVPRIVALNKADLAGDWEISDGDLAMLAAKGWPIFRTSAKTGESVEAAFSDLARRCALFSKSGDRP